MRSLQEWRGASDDVQPPPRVKMRVFLRFYGICQCGCARNIRTGESWQLDHRKALINGGKNRESNLVPMLSEHHKNKTAADVREKSHTYKRRASHYGMRRTKRLMQGWKNFQGEAVRNPKIRKA
jgi:5-methylcytosine-specific restriction protein A